MISQNPKTQTCCVKEWSRCRSTPTQRNGRRDVAGEFSALESRSTKWTWRPLSPTRGLSAMEVSDHIFPCQTVCPVRYSYKHGFFLHHSGSEFQCIWINTFRAFSRHVAAFSLFLITFSVRSACYCLSLLFFHFLLFASHQQLLSF